MNSKQGFIRGMMPVYSTTATAAKKIFGWNLILLLVGLLTACAPIQPKTVDVAAPENVGPIEVVSGEPQESLSPEAAATEAGSAQALPVRFQQPSYLINQMAKTGLDEDIVEPVGADITTTSGPVTLLDIIKRLAALKNMNVSWASDVDQYVMTDVDIRADDDFFQAVDNLLRQVDYFHEMQGNTIVIKYKETMDFHIAMPPRLSTISSSSNVGDAAVTSLSADTSTNRWDEVRHNLDQILDIWEEPATSGAPPVPAAASEEGETEVAAPPAPTAAIRRSAKGYYSINELIGLITVTAPRPLLARIADYIDSLKEELYRQVAIEAKIIEVTLNESQTTGLDWSEVLNNFEIDFELFGGTGVIHPRSGEMAISQITIPGSINAVLDAIAEQGTMKVLSNPKVSVMNGQPAIIYVGENETYIDSVTSTVSGDSGTVSTTVTTAQTTSGIRLEVYPTIISDDEIIMSLTPMVSGLNGEIEYISFGGGDNVVGVPVVKEQTMNTIIRVRNGELLVVGGLIDRKNEVDENKVRGLGDIPLIDRLFKSTAKRSDTTEIVILLQPRII